MTGSWQVDSTGAEQHCLLRIPSCAQHLVLLAALHEPFNHNAVLAEQELSAEGWVAPALLVHHMLAMPTLNASLSVCFPRGRCFWQ